jgi:pimeloyl-ACP methyl ester carboxylesterase
MPQLRTLQLSQGPLQYLERGQGQPIVFVHGLMVDSKLWLPVVPELTCLSQAWLAWLPISWPPLICMT